MKRRLPRSIGRGIFGADAAEYDDARLDYPQELYRTVFARSGLSNRPQIVEIGAGTGLATRDLLLRQPQRLVAIEPDEHMASLLSTKLAHAGTQLEIEQQPFESVELEQSSFDLAVAAASFHWMEPIATLMRIRSALRPSGTLALWWNVYRAANIGDAFADEVKPLLQDLRLPPSEGASGHQSLDERWHRTLLETCGFEEVEHIIFRRERMLDAGAMRALYASYSFVRALPEKERCRLLDAIATLVDKRFSGLAPNVVLTPLYIAIRP